MTNINREYKDRLFKFIFGNPTHKDWTLNLYNSLNGTNYQDPSELQLYTIDDVIYMGMKNDVSFILDGRINFYEQQSSANPNMPIRFLIYAGMSYSRYIDRNDINVYSTKQKQLPLPKCYCFYNGSKDQPERSVLKLTDAFPVKESDIEVCVTILNINYGHNQEIMDGCQSLKEYAMLTDEVRKEQQEGKSIDAAVSKAIDALPPDSVLRDYLLANKAEVTRMCITEYDEEKTMRLMREEEHEEGREEGRKEGDLERYQKDLQTLANNLQKSNPSLSDEDALKQAESLLKP